MSKKQAKAKPVPEIYKGLVRSNELAKKCVVVDKQGKLFIFDTPSQNHIVSRGVGKVVTNWEKFDEQPKEDILRWHQTMFHADPPKDQDLIDTSLMTYMKMVTGGEQRTSEAKEEQEVKERKILSRVYTLIPDADTSVIKTPQAKVCLVIFADTVNPETNQCDENTLRKACDTRAAEMHTRQDPWRIFQYYRPQLIKAGILRMSN